MSEQAEQKAVTKKMADRSKYTLLSPLIQGGKELKAGGDVMLTARQAAKLKAEKVI